MPLWYQTVRGGLLFLQVCCGTGIFAYILRRRKHFLARLATLIAIGFFFCTTVQYLTEKLWGQNTLPSRFCVALTAYLYAAIASCLCFREKIWTVLFVNASGYFAQDMGGNLKQLMKFIPAFDRLCSHSLGILAADLICYGGMFLLLFIVFRPVTRVRNDNFDDRVKALFCVIAFLSCNLFSLMSQLNPVRNALAVATESLYGIALQGTLLTLQFGVMEQAKLNTNISIMKELMHQQRLQYEMSKESMRQISEKHHDLKHMLASLRGLLPKDKLDCLEHSVNEYDIPFHTGHDVLDVLLSEQMAACRQREIELTCCVQSTDFDGVEELDLYFLLLNALDNAVRAAGDVRDADRRYVLLSSNRTGDMLFIHVENTFAGSVEFEDDLPKFCGNPEEHGFGMKSMRHTAEKYHGTISASLEGDIFHLDVLLVLNVGH